MVFVGSTSIYEECQNNNVYQFQIFFIVFRTTVDDMWLKIKEIEY